MSLAVPFEAAWSASSSAEGEAPVGWGKIGDGSSGLEDTAERRGEGR